MKQILLILTLILLTNTFIFSQTKVDKLVSIEMPGKVKKSDSIGFIRGYRKSSEFKPITFVSNRNGEAICDV